MGEWINGRDQTKLVVGLFVAILLLGIGIYAYWNEQSTIRKYHLQDFQVTKAIHHIESNATEVWLKNISGSDLHNVTTYDASLPIRIPLTPLSFKDVLHDGETIQSVCHGFDDAITVEYYTHDVGKIVSVIGFGPIVTSAP